MGPERSMSALRRLVELNTAVPTRARAAGALAPLGEDAAEKARVLSLASCVLLSSTSKPFVGMATGRDIAVNANTSET